MLVGRFWADIECHHPQVETLHLPPEVAVAWKERLRTYTTTSGEVKVRRNYLNLLGHIRAFYLDIQEMALQDPTWAPWAAPSPIQRGDLAGMAKARKATVAAMHQRIRERLPHLSLIAERAEAHNSTLADLLAAAAATPVGEAFAHGGSKYVRTNYKAYITSQIRQRPSTVLIEDTETGTQTDVTEAEDDAFWTWAIIATLRETGVRIEELMEITQLAIVSYRLPETGELVPLLQIVPSKSNEERLLLISPELASVLASIVKRLRDQHDGAIPLVARYDGHEKVLRPPLPHLFQRKVGYRPSAISTSQVKRMLGDTLARTGLRNAAGDPLTYTPHDFRRIFTTEAVAGGLPVHIAAKLLGHHGIATVESYLAVFQEDLISAYRSFLAGRRAQRPEAEYRAPTEEEWNEFEAHFRQRKLELGTCARPYGTPCKHEHACIRCPMLRLDPAQHHRLEEIIRNLGERIAEARANGWLGEVEGLAASRDAAVAKLAAAHRAQDRSRTASGSTPLGIPTIRADTKKPGP
jgi:integrase